MLAATIAVRTAPAPETSPSELQNLKRHLQDYFAWDDRCKVGRGAPGGVPYADYMRGTVPASSFGLESEPDPWTCKLLDACVDEVSALRRPSFSLARAALAVRYRSAGLPSVFRSGRLTGLELEEIENLADEVEIALVPIAKRRGLPL